MYIFENLKKIRYFNIICIYGILNANMYGIFNIHFLFSCVPHFFLHVLSQYPQVSFTFVSSFLLYVWHVCFCFSSLPQCIFLFKITPILMFAFVYIFLAFSFLYFKLAHQRTCWYLLVLTTNKQKREKKTIKIIKYKSWNKILSLK